MVGSSGLTAINLNFVPPRTSVELRLYNIGEYALLDDIHLTYDRVVYHTICDNSADYRYGFNGQEKDNEKAGLGNTIVFEFRIHDSRLGRFLSLDPLRAKYPANSPYCFAENKVINGIDAEGAGYVLRIYSPVQSARVKAAILSANLLEARRITYYALNHGFDNPKFYEKHPYLILNPENNPRRTSATLLWNDQTPIDELAVYFYGRNEEGWIECTGVKRFKAAEKTKGVGDRNWPVDVMLYNREDVADRSGDWYYGELDFKGYLWMQAFLPHL